MSKLLSLLVTGIIGSASAQVPVVTNVPASGAPAISGDFIAFPGAKIVDGGTRVIHTLRYYSISSGTTVDTDKQLAVPDRNFEPASPSMSGSIIAYVAPSASFNIARLRHFNVMTGQDVDTGQDLYLSPGSWSSRPATISGDLIAYITPQSQLAYYRVSTGISTITGLEAHGKPGISGNLIAYLNGNGCTIRYYNVATSVDTNIGHFNICDEAPAISGNVVAFTSGLTNPNTIVYHNISTGITSDTGTNGFWRSISGNVIAFMGENLLRYYRINQQSSVETGLPLYTQPDVSNGVIAYAPFVDNSDPFNPYRISYLRVEGTDTTMPSIAITSPTATSYNLGQAVPAQFACSDAESGIASCTGTVASGQYIDTSTEGSKVFSVSAIDAAGNSATKSVPYTVARRPPAGTQTADLSLGMKHNAAKSGASPGAAVIYTLTVGNAGPSTATALQIRDDVPAGMTVEGASTGYNLLPGGPTGSQVVIDIPSLAAGGNVAVTLTMRITASPGTSITNAASVASTSYDPKTNNNAAKAIINVK